MRVTFSRTSDASPSRVGRAAAAVLPLTPERVGDAAPPAAPPVRLPGIAEAFRHFQPTLRFREQVPGDPQGRAVEIALEVPFRSVRDFDPASIRVAGGHETDLARLDRAAERLAELREQFARPRVRDAWSSPEQRPAVLAAFRELAGRLGSPEDEATGERSPAAGSGRLGPEVKRRLEDIFSFLPDEDGSPADAPGTRDAEPAEAFCRRMEEVEPLLSPEDTHAACLARFDARAEAVERVRAAAWRRLLSRVRPLERSYRLLHLFFVNAEGEGTAGEPAPALYVVDADPEAGAGAGAAAETVGALLHERNGRPDSREHVALVAVPGRPEAEALRRFVESVDAGGATLVTDLREGAVAPDTPAALAMHGRILGIHADLLLREGHEFEREGDDAGALFGSAALVACAALLRSAGEGEATDDVRRRALLGRIRGVRRAREELGPSALSDLEKRSPGGPLVAVVRDAANDLVLVRTAATEAEAPPPAPASGEPARAEPARSEPAAADEAVLARVQRWLGMLVGQIRGERLTRRLVREEVEEPLRDLLDGARRRGTVEGYRLEVDADSDRLAQGHFAVAVELELSGGRRFRIAGS